MDSIFKQLRSSRREKEMAFAHSLNDASFQMPGLKGEWIWPPLSNDLRPPELGTIDAVPLTSTLQYAKRRLRELQDLHDYENHWQASLSKADTVTMGRDSVYHPLRSRTGIRVLEIARGNLDDPLIGQFNYANLADSHIAFEALSYVWNPRETFDYLSSGLDEPSIVCDGQRLTITRNLECALRNIRSTLEAKSLWVDALCINQQDVEERGHQVSMMSTIYRKATKVVIWIGYPKIPSNSWKYQESEESEESQAQNALCAVCYLVNKWQGEGDDAERASFSLYRNERECVDERVAENPHIKVESDSLWLDQAHRHFPGDAGLSLDDSPETAKDSPFWHSLDRLYSRSWFWRLWVIQEVVLSSDAVVRIDGSEIAWKWIGLAAAILKNSFNGICEGLHMTGVYNAYLIYRMSATCSQEPIKPSFVQLMRMTRQFDVSDPRDRVYSLLGMETTDNNPVRGELYLPPDYSIASTALWKKVFWKHMSEKGDISMLNSVQFSAEDIDTTEISDDFDNTPVAKSWAFDRFFLRFKNLSTWIPDWEMVCRSTLIPWAANDFFEASKGMLLVLHDEQNAHPNSLIVDGIEVGTISLRAPSAGQYGSFGLLYTGSLSQFFRNEHGLRLLARTMVADKDKNCFLQKDEGQTLAGFAAYISSQAETPPWRFISHLYETDEFGGPGFGDVLTSDATFRSLLTNLGSNGNASRYKVALQPVCERRYIFFSLNGFIGIGPDAVQEGDVICILSGAQTPFILRPIPNPNDDLPQEGEFQEGKSALKRQYYVVVGECFVCGLMEGEAVTASKKNVPLIGPVPMELIARSILEGCGEKKREIWDTVPALDIEQATRMVSESLESSAETKLTRKRIVII